MDRGTLGYTTCKSTSYVHILYGLCIFSVESVNFSFSSLITYAE